MTPCTFWLLAQRMRRSFLPLVVSTCTSRQSGGPGSLLRIVLGSHLTTCAYGSCWISCRASRVCVVCAGMARRATTQAAAGGLASTTGWRQQRRPSAACALRVVALLAHPAILSEQPEAVPPHMQLRRLLAAAHCNQRHGVHRRRSLLSSCHGLGGGFR